MRVRNINILFQLVAIISFLAIDQAIMAQDTLVVKSVEVRFRKNLESLGNLFCWGDPEFSKGKFQINPVKDFSTEFEKLNLTIFYGQNQQSENYYRFLEQLPERDKQNLIRYFFVYEKFFESVLEKSDLPADLKYMAPAISAMNRDFTGPDTRAGIWQLTHFEGVLNGLQINRLVDERLNEQLSTLCYARVIRQNIENFGSVELAVLAHWLGNAKIKNALSFAENGTTWQDLRVFLPDTVSKYIAAYQATALFLNKNRYKENVNAPMISSLADTVKINTQLHFKQVNEVLGIPEKQLEFLNPQYRFFIVPGENRISKLALPKGYRDDFIIWQDSIYQTFDSTLFNVVAQKIEYPPSPNRQYLGEPVKDLEIEGKTKIQYRLKTGDVLGIIAEKYDVRVADLKYWNNITNERRIQAGRKLDIFVDDDKMDYYSNLEKEESGEIIQNQNLAERIQQSTILPVYEDLSKTEKVEHVVKNGESPYVIAKEYEGVTPEQILEWNNINDPRKIQVGQKLVIYLKK